MQEVINKIKVENNLEDMLVLCKDILQRKQQTVKLARIIIGLCCHCGLKSIMSTVMVFFLIVIVSMKIINVWYSHDVIVDKTELLGHQHQEAKALAFH